MKNLPTFEEYQNGVDILITLPSSTDFIVYQKELKEVEDGSSVLNFKVPFFPNKSKVGNRCYLVYKGNIIGWMKIVGFEEKAFTCETTGRKWNGKFIQRSGKFHFISPIPYKGFQGFRYVDNELMNKLK